MSPFLTPSLDANGALRWIRDWAFPVRDAVGLVIRMAGVAEDVTKRRQLEMQLRQAQKMEAIGPLAIGVAHDFKNLLSVISGHSELLAMSLLADSPGLDSVDQIQIGRAAERGAALIRQLLAFRAAIRWFATASCTPKRPSCKNPSLSMPFLKSLGKS